MKKERKKNKGRMASAICHLLGCLILAAVIISLLPITVPRFLGYEIYSVISGSMEPEIPVGSVAYVRPVEPSSLQEGDIVAFHSNGSVIIHRVVSNHQIEGYLITKGDANEEVDLGEVSYPVINGLVVKHVPVIGEFMIVFSNTMGKVLLLCLALCGALLNVLAGRYRE